MVAAPITAASPETPARMRARPQLRRSSWVVAEVLSLRTTWGDAAQLPECDLQSLLRSQCFQKGHQRRCCMGALVSGAGSALVNAAMFS